MLPTRQISRLYPTLKQSLVQKATFVAGPPKVRIPIGEKIATGVTMALLSVSVPGYILVNLGNYRNKE